MLVKKYTARDMHEAMTTVIRELGADAVVLNNRKIRQKGFFGIFKKRHVELMVAYDPEQVPAVKKLRENMTPAVASAPPKSADSNPYDQTQVEHLTRRLGELDEMLRGFVDKFTYVKRDVTYDYPEQVQEFFCNMLEHQVREELAHSIAKDAVSVLNHQPDASPTEVVSHLVMELLGSVHVVQHKKFTQKVVLVVGPTGVGKTTSIVKLAANFVMNKQKKVGIINTDTYRIAAQEQMKTYADILEIPLQVIYKPEELEEALESMSDLDLIFIDTAGKQPGDPSHCEDVKKIIALTAPEDILLCISASISFPSAKEIMDSYRFLPHYKLVVTKLDETKYRGMILNLAWYSKMPLSYVTTGQNVPNDIEELDAEHVTAEILDIDKALVPEHIVENFPAPERLSRPKSLPVNKAPVPQQIPEESPAPERRPRGRPKKATVPQQNPEGSPAPERRPRGRPRKAPVKKETEAVKHE
jgi:flagellar biosynthesis protein FlhF